MKIAIRRLVVCLEALMFVILVVIILKEIFQSSSFSLKLKYRNDSGWRIRSEYRQYAGRALPTVPPPTPSYNKRKALQIADKCRKYSPGGHRLKSAYHSLFVHESKRFIYCLVHGVSPSKWSRVLTHGSDRLYQQRLTVKRLSAETANRWRMDGHGPLVPLNRWFYTEEQIASRLSTYYKFAFFRHPLERLIAVYLHERYASSTSIAAAALKPVVPVESRSNSSLDVRAVPEGKRIEHDEDGRATIRHNEVSFADYVRNILKKRNHKSYDPVSMFWRPQHALCQPCVIQYDFIGDYDVMNDDADYVLDRIGIKNVGFPRRPTEEREDMSLKLSELMSELSQDEIYRLKKFYSVDFELFNFTYTL